MGMTRRLCAIVFFVAAIAWAALIASAIRDPESEPHRLTQARAGALVVAFVAGSIAFTRRKG
jgi:hypothetical protein